MSNENRGEYYRYELDAKWGKSQKGGLHELKPVDGSEEIMAELDENNNDLKARVLRFLSKKIPYHFILFHRGDRPDRILEVGTASGDAINASSKDKNYLK